MTQTERYFPEQHHNVERVTLGNLSSASIPKALMRAIKEERVQSGDKILLSAFGAGLYASSVVVELG